MKKAILKKVSFNKDIQTYWINESKIYSDEENLILNFLMESYDGIFIRKWLSNTNWTETGNESIDLKKQDNNIIFSDALDYEKEDKFEFAVSRVQFLKILNQWEQARLDNLEYIVIEVSQNHDVTIYGTDSLATH